MVILLIVYVDVLVVLNTLVNYFILLGVRKITRAHTVRWRIALGAFSNFGGKSFCECRLEHTFCSSHDLFYYICDFIFIGFHE